MAKSKPKVVCLCGSIRFGTEFLAQNRRFTLEGKIVLMPGVFSSERDLGNEVKIKLDNLHLQKIRMADEVFVINVGDYIGFSTRNEIDFAKGRGIPITYMEPHEEV